jgi:uncharacterized repeat protein (TIGR01451 family)
MRTRARKETRKEEGEKLAMHAKTSTRKEKQEMGTEKGRSRAVLWLVAVVLAAALAVPGIALALTPAGTNITNQAEATWTDANNNPYTQLSNTTTVTVTSVYGILLTDPGDKTGVPLDNVSYGYTIQNTGNATDNYALSAVSVPAWATSIYVDTNQDGIYQSGEPAVSSPVQINAGDNAYIVVVVTIPTATPDGTTAATTLTVTGSLGGAEDDASDVSTTTVQAPVLGVVKNVRNVTLGGSFDNTATAAPNQELEYRITVTNSGSSSASTLVLSDPLDANTGYKMASATFTAGTSGLTGATAAFSNTPAPGPYVYGYTPVDQGCSAPAGYDYCVTSVRWTMTGTMAGGGTNFNVNFTVLVK